ncbi:MAG: gliding motility-associated C-terminal domain-containing protein [Bacteroidia bacterium]
MKKRILLILCVCLSLVEISAQSVGGTTSGGATFCSFTNSGFVSVTGYTGSILNWEASVNGGPWTNVGNTTPNQSYFNINQTTCYRAVVKQGAFPADTSTVVCVTIYAPTVPGTISGGGTFCATSGSGTLTLSGNTGGVLNWMSSTDGGITWTNIANTTTTLNYVGITQNTLYSAVVQNSAFCLADTSSQVSFSIDPATVAGTVSASASVCPGINSGTLTLSGNTGTINGWLSSTDGGLTWSAIANTTTTQTYNGIIQNTSYAAIVQSGSCPQDTSASATLTVYSLPTVSAGNDTTILPGQTVTLNGSGTGTPFWLNGSTLSGTAIFNPVASPAVTTSYILTVTDVNSCINADTVTITVNNPTFNGVVSNYFSPNGDGINDTWYIENIKAYPDNEVTVFNIYGQEVYSKKPYLNDWKGTYNGSDLPDGTYFYVLKFTNASKIVKGSVDILHKK